jgi:2-methylcitrate dehydratase PrpD
MFNDLNKRFFIDDCYIKLYPSCRHTHAPIDAVFELLLEYKFDISDIDDILVKTYPTAISFAGEIFRPESAEAAKFSIPYCICAALTKRNFGLNELSSECLNNPAILALTDKVRIEADASLESSVPNVKGAEVYISLNDGRKLYKRIDLPKGEIENPVTRNELIRKLESCTSYCFNDKKRQEIINLVFNLEKKDNINGLVALLGSNS